MFLFILFVNSNSYCLWFFFFLHIIINTIIDTVITSMANNSTQKETPIIVPTETLVESNECWVTLEVGITGSSEIIHSIELFRVLILTPQFGSIFKKIFVLLLLIASGFDITQLCMCPTIISDSTMLVLNTLALYSTFLDVPSAQRKCSCVM